MNRRQFLIGMSAFALLPWSARAEDYEMPPQEGDFVWKNPGAAPFRGTSDEACDLLLFGDDLVPPSMGIFLREAAKGQPDWTEEIPRNYRFTRMTFTTSSGHVVARNVVAATDEWRSDRTRLADFYRARAADGRFYLLIRPHVCGNWSLRVLSLQGECIRDEILCQEECDELHQLQETEDKL